MIWLQYSSYESVCSGSDKNSLERDFCLFIPIYLSCFHSSVKRHTLPHSLHHHVISKWRSKQPVKQPIYTAVTATIATHTKVPGSSSCTYVSKVTETQCSSARATKCAQEAEGLPWCHNCIAKSNQMQCSYTVAAIFGGGVQE